ncbi:hypothetical protein V5799_021006 [Amblyomma americanum]|uniref:Uncharacterized protein n=1 Tax=Amblyomma americanum TaxID=6943 RepID=A0AAQ4FS74_AMBAM
MRDLKTRTVRYAGNFGGKRLWKRTQEYFEKKQVRRVCRNLTRRGVRHPSALLSPVRSGGPAAEPGGAVGAGVRGCRGTLPAHQVGRPARRAPARSHTDAVREGRAGESGRPLPVRRRRPERPDRRTGLRNAVAVAAGGLECPEKPWSLTENKHSAAAFYGRRLTFYLCAVSAYCLKCTCSQSL